MCKYHCPSLACYLLLLGKNVFGFEVKGIARSQIDDSTCFLQVKKFLLNLFYHVYHVTSELGLV